MALAILILALGCTALFAMVGDLAAKVNANDQANAEDLRVHDIESVRLQSTPSSWLSGLDGVAAPDGRSAIVILGALCSTCTRFAAGTLGDLSFLADYRLAFVISGPSEKRLEDFMSIGTALRALPVPIATDPRGEWLISTLGIDTSPAVVSFDGGVVTGALGFTSLPGLRMALSQLDVHPRPNSQADSQRQSAIRVVATADKQSKGSHEDEQ